MICCLYLANALNDAGYLVEAHTEGSCIVEGKVKLPDLFIIEKDLPAIDGLAICKYPFVSTLEFIRNPRKFQ
jgi:DNA-binding response OmpR family regulator